MAASVDIRYWDSSCFLAWFMEEEGRVDDCRRVIRAAEKGEVVLVTSALTLAEVLWLRGNPKIPVDRSKRVEDFFRQMYIKVRAVDRFTAESARGLVWHESIQPKDAIHVATALRSELTLMDTFDEPLQAFSGKLGNPPLRIARPHVQGQESLPGIPGG